MQRDFELKKVLGLDAVVVVQAKVVVVVVSNEFGML